MLSSEVSFSSLLPVAAALTLIPELNIYLQDIYLYSSMPTQPYLEFLLQPVKGTITFLELGKSLVPLYLEKAEVNNLQLHFLVTQIFELF